MSTLVKLLCALSLCVTLGTAADTQTNRGPVNFSAYDTNKDGAISEDEFYAHKAERMQSKADAGMPMRNAGNSPDFSFFDTDKDGKISPIELEAGQTLQMQNSKKGMGRMQQ